ncbi:hypothetical protein M2G63_21080 [Vibrio vulnificus]|nr:hypothetical protein [Vibrio vulnificus]MCU8540549.1 hypothetical protein [Vibrio vulnificus]MCU8545125.1 hypothetical protein [Vibrio vulnificus]
MKYFKMVCFGLLNVVLFLLSALLHSDDENTKQIDDFDNPDSDPFHDGDWEDHNGNTYSQHTDGNHYDSFGKKWND